MEERTRLETAASDAPLSVRSFTIDEWLDRPFEVSILAVSPRDDVDLDQIVGRGASFSIQTGRPACPRRTYTGFCSHAYQAAVESTGLSTYVLQIVPMFWRTRLRVGSRIYQHVGPIDIVTQLLAEWDIDPLLALDRSLYPAFEYRVQYGETDFAFVSRILEEAGVSYGFRQPGASPEGDAEEGTTRLCLTDRPDAVPPRLGGPLRFFADDSTPSANTEWVSRLRIGRNAKAGRFTLHDHDFRLHANVALAAEAHGSSPLEDRYEHFVYAPGAMLVEPDGGPARSVPSYGQGLAQRWLESRRGDARTITFTTSAYDLGAGTVFSIEGHPHPLVSNLERLLVTRQTISGDSDADWTVTGEAVPASTPRRPAMITPRPSISGLMSAVVVGPPGEEIHTDPMGRVRVVFHWDRRARTGAAQAGESSCWIRVSQGWAGKGFGMFSLPRVGDEVLVDFLGGDPDQPIIVGRLHNAGAPTAYRLPEHKTRTTWRSDSSPGSGGYNEISFEDRKGGELVFVQAERDLETVVKGAERRTVAQARQTRVSGDDAKVVTGNETTHVSGDRRSEVEGFEGVSSQSGYSLASGRAGLSMRPDGSIALSNGQASIVLSGPNVYIDAASHIRATAGEVAALFGGEVHIDGRPNVFINSRFAAEPAPLGASAHPSGYDAVGLDPAEQKFQDDLGSLPQTIPLPPSINEQLQRHAMVAMVPGSPFVLTDKLRTRAELLRDRLRERAEMARERAEELLVDLSARVEAAKQQVISRFEAAKARAEAIRDRTVAELESIRARALAARDRVMAGVQNIRDRVTQTAETIHARIDAAKTQITARVEAIKARIIAQRDAIVARFDAMKESVRAVRRSMVESVNRQIDQLKADGMAIVKTIEDTVEQVKNDAKAMVEGIKQELGLMKDEVSTAVEEIKESAKAAVDNVKEGVAQLKDALGLGGKGGGDGAGALPASGGLPDGAPPSGAGLPDGGLPQGGVAANGGGAKPSGRQIGESDGAAMKRRSSMKDAPRVSEPAQMGGASRLSGAAPGDRASLGATPLARGSELEDPTARRRGEGDDFWDQAKAAGGEAESQESAGRGGAGQATSPFAQHTAMTRSGGFGGAEVGHTVNGTEGATFLQSPSEGQLMVVRSPGAREIDSHVLGTEVVNAQMEGEPVAQRLSSRLGQEGYTVYERPWGNFEGDFVKVAGGSVA